MASIVSADGLDVSALRLFLDVVELASVSKAATRHRMSQPSATAKLHKLERQLGVRLLDRGPTGSAPTAAGLELVPACAEFVSTAVGLIERGEQLRSRQRRLTVATTRHVAEHFLPGWVARWDSPETVLDVLEADTLAVASAVRSREAVLGFTDGPAAPIGLRSQVVATESIVAVVAAGHPLARRRRPCTGRELVEQPLIVTPRGSGTLDVIEQAIAARGLSADGGRHEVANSAAARLAAVNGAGVAFLPRCRVDADLAAGLLAVVSLVDLVILQPVRAVWRGASPGQLPARRLLAVATGD